MGRGFRLAETDPERLSAEPEAFQVADLRIPRPSLGIILHASDACAACFKATGISGK